jgi:hypothetical protein
MNKNGTKYVVEVADLLDSFSMTGTDETEFFKVLSAIDTATQRLDIEMPELQYAVVEPSVMTTDGDPVYRLVNEKDMVIGAKTQIRKMPAAFIEGIDPDIYAEAKSLGCFAFVDKRCYFMSRNMLSSLGARADLTGAPILEPSYDMFRHYMRIFTSKKAKGSLIMRVAGNIAKLMSCRSVTFNHQPLTVLQDITGLFDESLGKHTCIIWNVDNRRSEIEYEFPDLAEEFAKLYNLPDKIIPGIRLCTSDVGESSIIAEGTMNIGNRKLYTSSYKRRHAGKFTIEEVLSDIEKTVFMDYTKLPDRLAELMLIDIENPVDITERVLEIIGLGDIIGNFIAKKTAELMLSEIDPTLKCTAYDIALNVMSIPDRLIVSDKKVADSTVLKAQHKLKAAAFVDYEKLLKTTSVILAA